MIFHGIKSVENHMKQIRWYTLEVQHKSHLKNDSWKTTFPFGMILKMFTRKTIRYPLKIDGWFR